MLGLPRPEVINPPEFEEISDDTVGLSSETTWETDQSGCIDVPFWLRKLHESDEPMYEVDRAGPSRYRDEREESMETEPEEDPEEEPMEEEPINVDEDVQPALNSEATPSPAAKPRSPVYIEISSDSAKSLERNDSPIPVESQIPMPSGPVCDFPLFAPADTIPTLGSIYDDTPSWAEYWSHYTGGPHQSEADLSWWDLNIPQVGSPQDIPTPTPISSIGIETSAVDPTPRRDTFGIGAFIARQNAAGRSGRPIDLCRETDPFGLRTPCVGRVNPNSSRRVDQYVNPTPNPMPPVYPSGYYEGESSRARSSVGYHCYAGNGQEYLMPRQERRFLYSIGQTPPNMFLCHLCGQVTPSYPFAPQYWASCQSMEMSRIICYTCGGAGHYATSCPTRCSEPRATPIHSTLNLSEGRYNLRG
ncbi:hypothetical protein AALP_AAs55321U000100 [Arabis alpina]|uniref:CCHC-type domain-containing protein n=1 Tax=Arabis alpina TaxID=50452 RepID=A0A087G1F0_ARAAL|nr:hypothetical protein AALP_AAs55321U000100 [Arabis alpina]